MIEGEAHRVLSRRRSLTLAGLSAGGHTFGGCGLLSGVGWGSLSRLRHAKRTGDVREYSVVAALVGLEVGGRGVHTWGYDGAGPYLINHEECIDCGVCEPECLAEAMYLEDEVPGEMESYITEAAEFEHSGVELG